MFSSPDICKCYECQVCTDILLRALFMTVIYMNRRMHRQSRVVLVDGFSSAVLCIKLAVKLTEEEEKENEVEQLFFQSIYLIQLCLVENWFWDLPYSTD